MVTESCVHLYDTNFANNADARAFCQRKGAELARIRDYDDLNFIASVIGKLIYKIRLCSDYLSTTFVCV